MPETTNPTALISLVDREPLLLVLCEVLETRTIFGRPELRIRPVAGRGECWIAETRLRLERDNP